MSAFDIDTLRNELAHVKDRLVKERLARRNVEHEMVKAQGRADQWERKYAERSAEIERIKRAKKPKKQTAPSFTPGPSRSESLLRSRMGRMSKQMQEMARGRNKQ